MNPVLAREVRARWRDKRNFLVVIAIAMALTVLTLWMYKQRLDQQDDPYQYGYNPSAFVDTNASMADVGRYLFRWLTMTQVVAWLLIGPCVAAPSIAGERERGLLEGLWLSQMKPISLLLGRLGACLGFMLLLQVTTLPFLALCLILGGVSPGEIFVSEGMQFLTTLAGVSLGLCASARNARPPGALASAVGMLAFWSALTYVGAGLTSPFYSWGTNWWDDVWQFTCLALRAIHPVTAMAVWLDPTSYGIVNYADFHLPASSAFLFIFTLVNLRLALKAMMRPLPEASWLGKNPLVERYRTYIRDRQEESQRRKETAKFADRAGGALLVDLPLHLFIRFRNPLLQREVRGRFRFRKLPFLLSLMRILLFLGISGVWLFIIFALTDYLQRSGAMEALVICLLIGGSVAVALMSASSFSRERESGTWESLRLSLLQPWTVVRSKWLSTLIAFGYYAAPFWILLPLGVTPWPRGQESLQLLISLGILLTTLGATGAVGLWVSWRSRNTATATGLMLGGLIFCHLALPALWAQLNIPGRILGYPYYYSYQYSYYGDYDSGDPGVRLLLDTIEAPMVFETLSTRTHRYSMGSDIYQANLARETICMLFYATVTGIFLWLVTRSVCHETRASSREGGSFIKTRLLPTLKYSRG